MIGYYSQLAWLSIRRNWFLAGIMVFCLSVGIASWVASRAAIGGVSRPLPHAPGLHLVEVERGPYYSDVVTLPDNLPVERTPRVLLSHREHEAIVAASPAARQTPTAAVEAAVSSERVRPFVDDVRLGSRDLFAMFELRFLRGGPWTPRADREPEMVAVVSASMSRRLFGDIETVGRRFRLAGQAFTVQGVVADSRGDKPYDAIFLRREHEQIFIPFSDGMALRLRPTDAIARKSEGGTYDDFLAGDALWIKLWVDLPDDAAKRAYAATLARSGVSGAHFVAFADAREDLVFIHPGYAILDIFAHVILIATVFNLVRLLLAKFTARADQMGIHRAMGASRRSIATVHLAEAKIIGLLGGFLGLVLGVAGAAVLNAIIPDRAADAAVDYAGAILTLFLSIFIGVVAGAYPAWRTTRIPPAVFLRRQ
ncbi:MAG TPA: FtsX-like permease family protein [Haliangiales bacterium]|nr:FtsX-like permease family protein [Haliangiales bacterium]